MKRWPYVLLVGISLALWLIGLYIHSGFIPLAHNGMDQHTRQAQAWIQGSIALLEAPSYQEIALYKGRAFNSFPPTPTVFELPMVLAVGSNTPSYLVLYLFSLVALLCLYDLAIRFKLGQLKAIGVSLCYVFGTNVFVSMVTGGVWAQGQVYGYCLAIIGLWMLRAHAIWAYFALALAVGCRPFYFFYLPLFVAFQRYWSQASWQDILRSIALGFVPYVFGLALYNWVRFDNPLEFGHKYLPWSQSLGHGIFSCYYLPNNLFHTFFKLPTLGTKHILEFDGRGTSFVINNPMIALGLAGLGMRSLSGFLRKTAVVTVAVVWFGLLLHESNGWFQFGFRYIIDIAPIAFIGVLAFFQKQRNDGAVLLCFFYSLAMNLYGIWWLAHQ
jgi:hypothetical protein